MSELGKQIADLRQVYCREELTEESVPDNPIAQFEKWFVEALDAQITEPNACTLATCGAEGRPSVRVVLLKGFDKDGFVFYTNYSSRKGQEMHENPYASLNFLWLGLERQVRVDGRIEKVSELESDVYFASRPRESQIGAWVSPQSQPISRQELQDRSVMLEEKYKGQNVPRPAHWGGYRLIPEQVEFWQGRPSRLHDRILYKRKNNSWEITRLAP